VLIAHHRKDRRRSVIYGLLALIMLAVALFGIPAE